NKALLEEAACARLTALCFREEVVHVLAFDVAEEDLRVPSDSGCAQRLCFHDGYTDPLGWNDSPPLTVLQFSPGEIHALLSRSEHPKPVTLVIDSLSWVLRHHPPAVVCQCLQELRRGGAVRSIVALLHSDLHQQGIVGSLCHLATAIVTVAPALRGHHTVAKTTRRTRSGRVTQEEECFIIKEDLTVTVQKQTHHPGQRDTEQEEPQADPAAHLTFNLRLSEAEKEAKDKLSLPFVFSQEKKSALLQPRPGAGQIIYEPDANDDFDQEDPDDDLDV
uniref:Elongator complex protein 5 n=1 Tax=Scleropages formosus TaxID=113540 RepID=A0A8C9TQB1_SCLFO